MTDESNRQNESKIKRNEKQKKLVTSNRESENIPLRKL